MVAGLGNPGKEYEGTRHNAGFIALDSISQSLNVRLDRARFKSCCGIASVGGKKALLMKPQTFMNLSGEAVAEASSFYKIPMEKVIVIYDDISLPVGKIRIRPKGSAGGHNGIKNIISLTGTDVFPRIKIGVGQKPRPDYDLVDWVLGRIPQTEKEQFAQAVESTARAAEMIIQEN
ncbi:MAG TPA: aminoacyl-tRNA hydrolase, partial [Clostridia bacterium]|nr:aminoacyl-tRNA hydrolase [Clostridia bacterium]